MGEKRSLTLVSQPQEYFRELVTEALGRQKIYTQPETEVYLVNLLNQFITTDRLYSPDISGNGGSKKEVLALMLKEALEQPLPRQQSVLFRQLGDVSLYVAGFFQDSLNRKLVDVDYYIEMGGSAYKQVALLTPEELLKALYLELAEKFSAFVDVLAAVSDKTSPRTEKDILRLYELWIRTGSERAAKALQDAGIQPNATMKKDSWQ